METKKLYSHKDREEILQDLKRHLDSDPSLIFRKNYAAAKLQPSVHVVNNHFMTWRNAMSKIGIDYEQYLKDRRDADLRWDW